MREQVDSRGPTTCRDATDDGLSRSRGARLRPTAEFALDADLKDMKADEAAVPHVNRRCTYRLCGMADEVGRHARQVVGQIVEEIRHHSLLLGQERGTCLNVPFL